MCKMKTHGKSEKTVLYTCISMMIDLLEDYGVLHEEELFIGKVSEKAHGFNRGMKA